MTCKHALLRTRSGGRCPICSDPVLERRGPELRSGRTRLAHETPHAKITTGEHFADETMLRDELAEAERLLTILDAAAYLRSIREFAIAAWPYVDPAGRPFRPNRASDAVALHLQALGDGLITRLGIEAPSGLGKSSWASVIYPAWMWARDPSWSVICASYAFKLSADIGRRFMRLVESDWYRLHFPHVRIAGSAQDRVTNTENGVRYAVGIEGAMTGFRTRAGILDDPLNAVDARSPEVVKNTNDWFDLAFSTRFDDGEHAAVLAIMQKLARGDIMDHLRDRGFEMLTLRAISDDRRRSTLIWTDPRERAGEVLAPEIHSAEFLELQRKTLGARGFETQYNQDAPVPGGQRFTRGNFRFCAIGGDGMPRARPAECWPGMAHVIGRRRDGSLDLDVACVTVDPTGGSTADGASELGIMLWAKKAERRFLLDDRTDGPATWGQTVPRIVTAVRAAAAIVGWQRKFVVLIEKKALGASAIEDVEKALAAGEIRYPDGRPVVAKVEQYPPAGEKMGAKDARADVLEGPVEAGLYHVLDGAPWVERVLGAFEIFPAKPNDRVDCCAQAEDRHRPPASGKRLAALAG